jgi:glycine/D-amino acid oxidase-like deaminating enzyme/NADPH-dependent 2,4-dienoyl-CoA reductase/sulfur reductase-like enzyme/Fe-S-cluster-containing hydrogenase component 2
MIKIEKHPILEVPRGEKLEFLFEGKKVTGEKGMSIASALHRAGYPVHSHSLKNRNRSLECGIGKCGACEMLVDEQIRRICITPCDGVKTVNEIPREYHPGFKKRSENAVKVYRTEVAIIGAGPAGLAAREVLNEHNVDNIVIDNNEMIGGQFLMQTHQFFFFENEKKFGGMRGFDIAKTLAGENPDGIFLNSTVWDILENKRLAVKNIKTHEIYYIDAEFLLIATGAVPFMPAFENDDMPGVYTAAVVQKMMNQEFTLLGKNILTVGAGNIGYLTSYQLMQAGATVKAIVEAQAFEGGFPVQANRVRRLGIPVITSHMLLKAIPNEKENGIRGAVIAECRDFEPIPGSERILEDIDAINICTGLVPDDLLLIKGREVFGRKCLGAGDAIRIGEGTSAVLRGKQAAMEILEEAGKPYDYNQYLGISKEYIDSQQHPQKVIDKPFLPDEQRKYEKPFVIIDCLYGFACNPCAFACPHGAITKTSTSTVPRIDFEKCIGCMKCVYQCPGLAIFGYDLKRKRLYLPLEYEASEKTGVYLVNNNGEIQGEGFIEKIRKNENKTNVAWVKALDIEDELLTEVRGFLLKDKYPDNLKWEDSKEEIPSETFICHCDDVKMQDILDVVGDRKFISVDEIKHTTRLGMGACRGKRCIKRLKQSIKSYGISVVGEPTPRGPMSNQLDMGELSSTSVKDEILFSTHNKKPEEIEVKALVAGGGIGGSALFRYLAEAGMAPLLINYGHGASWRNIAGGRPVFSVPELSDIATRNLEIFSELQSVHNIDFRKIRYVTFAHNEETYKSLEASMAWQESKMVTPADFRKEISPSFNQDSQEYLAALITENCWQATPGKTIDLIRKIGLENGGRISEDTQLIDVRKEEGKYLVLVRDHNGNYIKYRTDFFINALGPEGGKFASQLDLETGIYPVRHQAFITRRLPMMGINGEPLPMLIDRRKNKGFVAVYGQQLAETGQIIGCASPAVDPDQAGRNLKVNSRDFIEIVSEVFVNWLPELSAVGFQALWSGYYVEPRMIIDPEKGLFIGLRGQGFMLGQYLAKMYVDELTGKDVPDYFSRLRLEGDGLLETAFK